MAKNATIYLPKFFINRLFFLLLARQQILTIRNSEISTPALTTVISLFGRQRWSCDSLSFAKHVHDVNRHKSFLIQRRIILPCSSWFHFLEIRCLSPPSRRRLYKSLKKRFSDEKEPAFYFTNLFTRRESLVAIGHGKICFTLADVSFNRTAAKSSKGTQ